MSPGDIPQSGAPRPSYTTPKVTYVIRWLSKVDTDECYLGLDTKYGCIAVTRACAKQFASHDEARKFIRTRVMVGRAGSGASWCSIEESQHDR